MGKTEGSSSTSKLKMVKSMFGGAKHVMDSGKKSSSGSDGHEARRGRSRDPSPAASSDPNSARFTERYGLKGVASTVGGGVGGAVGFAIGSVAGGAGPIGQTVGSAIGRAAGAVAVVGVDVAEDVGKSILKSRKDKKKDRR